MDEKKIKKLIKDTPIKKLNFWEKLQMRIVEWRIKKELKNNPELDETIKDTLN